MHWQGETNALCSPFCLAASSVANQQEGCKREVKSNQTPTNTLSWVGVKNLGFTEKQKNIEQGSTKLKELHVCIMPVQKKMAAWRSEVP